MQEVFRFWGYGPDVYAETIGPAGPLRIPARPGGEPTFGRVTLGADLLERTGPLHDLCADGWWTWLLLDGDGTVRGEPLAWLTLPTGQRHALVTRTSTGAHHFHFDVDASLTFLQNERFLTPAPPLYLKLHVVPERLPPWLRRAGFNLLALLRNGLAPRQPLFPAAPADPSVDGWRQMIRSFVQEFTAAEPMRFWPARKTYAVTLSHDIDTDYSLRVPTAIEAFRSIEEAAGMRSVWMVVGKHVESGRRVLDDLYQAGHEIGCHGTHHDHRLAFLPPYKMTQRVKQAAALLERYDAVGLRSPNYLRTPALYHAMDGWFEYDMSMHDVVSAASGLTRMNEGCCTCMPFLIDQTDVLEIPTTIPEDWEFDLGGVSPDESRRRQWAAIKRIKALGGVANFLTHPEPHLSLRPRWLELYRDVLGELARDEDAWLARPDELNAHWRARKQRIDALWSREVCVSTAAVSQECH